MPNQDFSDMESSPNPSAVKAPSTTTVLQKPNSLPTLAMKLAFELARNTENDEVKEQACQTVPGNGSRSLDNSRDAQNLQIGSNQETPRRNSPTSSAIDSQSLSALIEDLSWENHPCGRDDNH